MKLRIKNGKRFFTIIILLIIISTVIMIINNNDNSNDLNNSDENKINQEMDSGENTNKDIGCAIPGWQSIIIPKNTKLVNVNFYNPIANKDLYYLSFEVQLGEELLYKSEMLKPGEELKQIELSRELDEGEYEVVIFVQPYRMNVEKTPTNNASMKTKLIVK